MENQFYESRKKLELLLKEITEKKYDAEVTFNRFCEIFAGEYKQTRESINQAYYQLDEQDFYLTDGSGISLCVYSGNMDRFGGSASHSGIDIVIKSPFSLDENGNRVITLFSEGKNVFNSESIDLESFCTIDLSIDKIKGTYDIDEAALSVLPEKVRNNKEIAAKRYELLKRKAESEYNDALAYEKISPYGGEDMVVVPAYNLLQVYIDDYKDDKYFYEQAMSFFVNDKDYESIINEEYKDLNDSLYIIENIDDYKMLAILQDKRIETEFECETLTEERAALEKRISELNIEKASLEARRYGLRSILLGERKTDKQLIEDISDKVSKLEKDYDDISQKYEAVKMDNEIAAYAADELRSRLKVPCYERNPERLLEKKDYFVARVKEIDSYRENKEIPKKLTLDEKIKNAALEPELSGETFFIANSKQPIAEEEIER